LAEKSEKRRSPRVRAEKTTSGRLKLTVPVAIRDVSLLGMRLELSNSLRPGQLYDLRADLNGVTLTAQVRITRCSAGGFGTDLAGARVLQYNAGAEFIQLEPDQRIVLEGWLSRMSKAARNPSSGTLSRVSGS
jgi:hypothetical protein